MDDALNREMVRRTALALTSWFEDVISQVGIWQAFTTECKRRYGSYLPFYDTSEECYSSAEINLADVQFLLWHYVQQNSMDRALINPENRGLRATAEAIYAIFDDEYEVAPENETLHKFFANFEVSATSFYPLREVMEWFCYGCYMNIYNESKLFDMTIDFFDAQDGERQNDRQYLNLMRYNLRVDHMLSTRNLLAFTSFQWLARIVKDPTKSELLSEIIYKRFISIYVESADDEYVYAREVSSDGQLFKISTESFDPKNIHLYLGNVAMTSLLYFDGVWWVSGAMMVVDTAKAEEEAAKKMKMQQMIKGAYDAFIEGAKGENQGYQ